MPRRIVMLTTSYPRFRGDGVGTFVEPISHGVAARGHDVHVIAPWHPLVERPAQEGDLHFHFFRYAPTKGLHVFGYASALKADVSLRSTAYLVAPLAVSAGAWALHRILRGARSSLVHAHWAVPSGFIGAIGRFGTHVPLVVSLHGSDVYLAEVNPLARAAARYTFDRAAWLTACSDDLAKRAVALGANPHRITVVPYGVDTERFSPDAGVRASLRQQHNLAEDDSVLVAAGRLVRKKGFEYLIDALPSLTERFFTSGPGRRRRRGPRGRASSPSRNPRGLGPCHLPRTGQTGRGRALAGRRRRRGCPFGERRFRQCGWASQCSVGGAVISDAGRRRDRSRRHGYCREGRRYRTKNRATR